MLQRADDEVWQKNMKEVGCQVFFHPDWILKGWENKAQSILDQGYIQTIQKYGNLFASWTYFRAF